MANPITREEKILNAIANGESLEFQPITREEMYLAYLAGEGEKPNKPITRKEMFLDKIELGGSGGGGDEASVVDSLIDRSITEISSNVANIGTQAFQFCHNLTSVNFPFATKIGNRAFEYCTTLTFVNFPMVADIGDSAFSNCDNLTTVNFPLVTRVRDYAFHTCRILTFVNLPMTTRIGNNAFNSCFTLKAVVLRSTTMCSLSNVNAFVSCFHFDGTVNATYNPNGDKDGYIYVPRALVDTYKSATNWSTFATQVRALEDYTVDGTITGELDETKI